MAKEIAIGKRAKISEAQQYMILAVLGASIVLGVAVSLTIRFVQQIAFNTNVIAAEEQSIAKYSDFIKTTGICKKPQGSVYSADELKKCNPDSIEVSEVPGTLRSNILEKLAANEALNSVPREDSTSCINPNTNKNYTYKELQKIYNDATTSEGLSAASQLIKSCSALRVIPDALPAFKNEEALLASLNKLFIMSNWEPESISSGSDDMSDDLELSANVEPLSVNLVISASAGTTMNILDHIERSIREFDVKTATIEYSGSGEFDLKARAYAYYMEEPAITETTKSITPDTKVTGGK